MSKPKALDMFCGAGGASMGLNKAGFDVTGIDIEDQPNYPFAFEKRNALTVSSIEIGRYDMVWASPPCQAYTSMLFHGQSNKEYPDLIDCVRRRLEGSGVPWVIENVEGAPLHNPIMLCGEMFGLRVIRHRLFESNVLLFAPDHKPHNPKGCIRKQGDGGYYYRVYGHETGKASWGEAMRIDWMRSPELTQAIPPAYSEWIGKQLMDALTTHSKEGR